jgi:hypothetical protein
MTKEWFMRKLRVSVWAAGLVLVSAACGSSNGSGAEPTESSGAASTAVTAVTVAPVETTLPVDTAAPTPPAGGDAECLQGTWLQGPERLQSFLSQVGTPLMLSVLPDSLMTLTINGDAVNITSTITLQANTGDMTMQMTGSGTYSGTMSADATSIDVVLASQEYVAGDWLATVDGQTISMPGMTAVDPGPPVNGIGTYTCTDTTLEVVASGRTSTFDRG